MKITRISWTNYKGLDDGTIESGGCNVTVSGRNGTGKSSIASIVGFVLFGKVAGTVKQYADGLAPTDDGLVHGAEITFDTGTTLRREYAWNGFQNRSLLYINGASVGQPAYRKAVYDLTQGGGEVVTDPFAFHRLKPNERREILLREFGTVKDEDLLSTEFRELSEYLNGATVDVFITRLKMDMRSPKAELAQMPGRLDELTRRIEVADVAAELAAVESELTLRQAERSSLTNQPARAYNLELALLQQRREELKRRKVSVREELEWLNEERNGLREEYLQVQRAAGICPTCGQAVPAMFNRSAKLTAIIARGKKCSAEVERREKILADINAERSALESQVAELTTSKQAQEAAECTGRITHLDNEIYALTARKAHLQNQASLLKRVATLRQRELELKEEMAHYEELLQTAEEFCRRKIELVEDAINSRFKHVKFKLYDYLITTGEARPTCEATLNGVPYEALSKGERFKAAFDVFRTLQSAYGVEFPVMLDDAESYTENSRVDLPNQIFAFRVADNDLTIRVIKTTCATALRKSA